jgi:DNA-binding transcriptional LysR family regulator
MPEPLDLLTLRVVQAVAECGSISAGSERVHLAVAAASARISALEAALGVRIFERSPRGVALTSAGRLLVERGARLLLDADRLVADLGDLSAGLAGHVRLLANASALLEVLPQRLRRFAATHPQIHVDVEERMSPPILEELAQGRADVGVVDVQTPTDGLSFHPFFDDSLVLVVPHGHPLCQAGPVRLEHLLEHNLIVLEGPNAVARRVSGAAAAAGRTLKVRMQMRSFDAASRMVAAGLGCAVLPHAAVAPQLQVLPVTAVAIDEPWARRTHFLALRTGADAPAGARTLVDALLLPD